MLIFGIDIPLVEILLVLGIIILVLLVEALVIILLQVRQTNKLRKLTTIVHGLSETLLEIKKKEIEELDKLRRK